IILSPSPKPRHAGICMRLYDLLRDALSESDFVIRFDTSMRLTGKDMPRPDVFAMDAVRWEAAELADKYPDCSPQLPIEIFSPSNARRTFKRKIDLYLKTGAVAVWVVHPEKKIVTVHTAERSMEYTERESIPLPAPLPRVLIPVARIFASGRLSKKS
ncbi:MAG: Uma2 family endonuclease, partial [Bryobacteraceae bacterium]